MSQPVPGWYPDPAGSQRLRWWNGGQWIDQYQPMPGVTVQGAPAQHGTPTPNNQQGVPGPRFQQGVPGPQGAPQQRQQGVPGPQGLPQQGVPGPRFQQGVPGPQSAPQQGAPQQRQHTQATIPGASQPGMRTQRSMPTPNNQQGIPGSRFQQGMPGPQGQPQQRQQEQVTTRDTPAKKTRHMPSAKPAPTVSSDPYNATGTKPTFDGSDDASSDKTDKKKQKSSSGKGWLIGTAAAWIAVIALAVTSIYVGTMFKSARADLAQAESEHSTAQSELDQANSDLQQANKDLEEAQK